MDLMDKARIRVYFDADDSLKLALKQEALNRDTSVSALIEEILKRELAKQVEAAEKVLKERAKQKPRKPD